jgi:hypothetical protein
MELKIGADDFTPLHFRIPLSTHSPEKSITLWSNTPNSAAGHVVTGSIPKNKK